MTHRTVHLTGPDGTVRDWLVTPAWATPCEDLAEHVAPEGDPFAVPDGDARLPRWVLTNGPDVGPLKERLAAAHPLDADAALPEVLEGGSVAWDAEGHRREAVWSRRRTGADGLVDWSEFCFTPEYRCALAATVLEVDQAEWRTIEVRSTGPFVLWLDGEPVLRSARVSYMEPEVSSVRVRLASRTTTLHVATWQVAFRECRHVVGVRVVGLPVRVVIPSPGADEHAARLAETLLAQVGSPSWALDGDEVTLSAPAGVALRARVCGAGAAGSWQSVRADAEGSVVVLLGAPGTAARVRPDAVAAPAPALVATPALVAAPEAVAAPEPTTAEAILATGETTLEVGVDDPRCPQVTRLRVAVLPPSCRMEPEGTPEEWRAEVLEHVATRGGVAAVLARQALDGGARVGARDVAAAVHRISTRGDCTDFEALALLLLWHRIPEASWEAGVREDVASALTGLKYWIDQPGLDAMCYFTENHQLVWHVAQTLAGEAFAQVRFAVDGRTGAEHAGEGRRRASAWMRRKLDGGFSEFDSNAYLAIDSYALAALVELGEDAGLAEAATTLLNKTLLTLASNSWRGIHGAAHGRSYVNTQRSARFEETSPILRLVAGVGSLNDAVLPVTMLATAQRYEVPSVVRALAGTEPEEWWGRQVYRGELAFERDLLERPYRSDVRVWRTPDVMLASVQDYRAGLPGLQEHVWCATLAPEVQVYVTHPANSDTGSSARPNGWVGHRVLPRVHQHLEALLHVQRFTSTDPVRSTHLWFPAARFEEWTFVGEWIAGRLGGGFVAVATPGGVEPVESGDTAWQEWLPASGGSASGGSAAGGSAWVCVVGTEERDGDFADFVAALGDTAIVWDHRGSGDPGALVIRPDGTTLELTFDTAFAVDGQPVGLGPEGRPEVEPHLDNPAVRLEFGADVAHVAWGGAELRLDLARARALLGG